jgi:ferric-dicitrate binding protein FerR (iron transport regulator)
MPVMQLILSNRLFKIAAVILLILTIPYIASRFTKPTPLVEIIVPAAQKMILTLLDGSKVTLDAGTVFQYPEKFDSHQREVYLNGEGYFDVTSNSDAPFVVHTDNAIITVMGTKFNVRSWKHNHQDKVTVAVVEGRVSLRPENVDHHDANVIISEGQSSELIENSYPSTPQFIDTNKSLSWLRREMYFQNVPLRDVLDQLERWYGYEIFLPDSSFFKSQVTVYIENKPIEENLEIISMMYDLQFKQEGIKIVFSKTN